MPSENQKRTIKISEEAYQALRETATKKHGNPEAVTWSGLIYNLCRQPEVVLE